MKRGLEEGRDVVTSPIPRRLPTFHVALAMHFSGAVKLGNLSDYIAPSNSCVVSQQAAPVVKLGGGDEVRAPPAHRLSRVGFGVTRVRGARLTRAGATGCGHCAAQQQPGGAATHATGQCGARPRSSREPGEDKLARLPGVQVGGGC